VADINTNMLIKIAAENKSAAAFNQLNSNLNTLKNTVLGVASALAGGLAFKDIIDSTRQWGQSVDQLQDQLGGTTEQMSKLLYVGRSVGLTTDDLSQTFGVLGKKIADSLPEIAKGTSEFDKWGVKLKDSSGSVVGFDEALRRVEQRFMEVGQNAQGSALLMDLFGKSGKSLSDFLALTDKQMAAMSQEAEDFGLVLSQTGSNSIEDFNRKLSRFDLEMTGIKLQIGMFVLPLLSGLLERIRQASGFFKALGEAIRRVTGFVKEFVDAIRSADPARAFTALAVQLGEIGTKLDSMGPAGTLAKDALLLLGGAAVLGALEAVVTKIGAIGLAITKLPKVILITADVVLLAEAWNKTADVVNLVARNWEPLRNAVHDGTITNTGLLETFLRGLVLWGDDFSNLGTLTQKKLAEWGQLFSNFGAGVKRVWDDIGAWFGQLMYDITVKLNQAILAINKVTGLQLPTAPGGSSPPNPRGGPQDATGPTPDLRDPNVQQRLIDEERARSGGGGGRRLAAGGIVMGPTQALIGEAGPEAVIPLGRGGGMGSVYVTVNVAGSLLRENDLYDTVADVMMRRLSSQRNMSY